MSSNNNWLCPIFDKSWNVFTDDWFSENSSSKIISDCSVGTFPHFLEIELLNSGFIRSNCSAFDSYFAIFNGLSGIKSNLIICLVSMLNSEIKILDV